MSTPVAASHPVVAAPAPLPQGGRVSPSISMTALSKIEDSISYFQNSIVSSSHATLSASGASIITSGTCIDGLEQFFELKTYDDAEDVPTPFEELPKSIQEILPCKPNAIFKKKISWSDPSLTTLVMPTNKAMLINLSYYMHKYGVPIALTASTLGVKKAILGSAFGPEVHTWGVIVTTGTPKVPHVTPLLIHRNSLWQLKVFDLDSANFTLPHLKVLLQGLLTSGVAIEVFKINQARQADPYSCRVDSMLVLKDAILDINRKSIKDIETYCSVDKSGPFEFYKGKFSLPAAWAKTVQISSALPSDLSQKVNTKKDESLSAFRARFIQKVTREENYRIQITHPTGHVKIHDISTLDTYSVNTYLRYKAFRLVKLVRHIIDEKNPSICNNYRRLKEIYNAH